MHRYGQICPQCGSNWMTCECPVPVDDANPPLPPPKGETKEAVVNSFDCPRCGSNGIPCDCPIPPADRLERGRPSFRLDLERLLNRYSQENGSNTPDFILARYLMACLSTYNVAVNARDRWYGVELRPGCSVPESMRPAYPTTSPQPSALSMNEGGDRLNVDQPVEPSANSMPEPSPPPSDVSIWAAWADKSCIPITGALGSATNPHGHIQENELYDGMRINVVLVQSRISSRDTCMVGLVAKKYAGRWWADSAPEEPGGVMVPLKVEDGIWKAAPHSIDKAIIAPILRRINRAR